MKQRTSKKQNTQTRPPRRSSTHRIDTAAIRTVRGKLTDDWLERSVEDRDYGVDMMVEAFEGDDATGTLVLFQVKGHRAGFGADPVSLAVPVKTLLYARMFGAPFFLLNVSIADDKVYFVWLQKYINTRLAVDSPRWNRQSHVNVYFPPDNVLNLDGLEKILKLSRSVAHRDMGITFMAHLTWLCRHVDEFRTDKHPAGLEQALIHLREISRLEHFLAAYEDFVEDLDVDELSKVLKKAKTYREF